MLNPSNNGLFGYYKLMDWYMNDFNDEERKRLRTAYGSAGMGTEFERFISGYESTFMAQGKERGPVDLFHTILSKISFQGGYPVDIVEKIVAKIESLITDDTDVLEKHFAYVTIKDFYKKQGNNEKFEQTALKMIAIAPQAKKAFEERWKGKVPNHSGFFDLVDYYERKKMFDKAEWVSDESERIWRKSIGISYDKWLDDLIEK